jgi:hypothetical protein
VNADSDGWGWKNSNPSVFHCQINRGHFSQLGVAFRVACGVSL